MLFGDANDSCNGEYLSTALELLMTIVQPSNARWRRRSRGYEGDLAILALLLLLFRTCILSVDKHLLRSQ